MMYAVDAALCATLEQELQLIVSLFNEAYKELQLHFVSWRFPNASKGTSRCFWERDAIISSFFFLSEFIDEHSFIQSAAAAVAFYPVQPGIKLKVATQKDFIFRCNAEQAQKGNFAVPLFLTPLLFQLSRTSTSVPEKIVLTDEA